jgi:hypothetical protein
MVPSGYNDGVRVRLKTLDDCLKQWGVEQVDLLKLDVEGYEPQVLGGARYALSTGKIRAMLCELNDWWLRRAGTSVERFHHLIESAGFRDISRTPRLGLGIDTRFFVHSTCLPDGSRTR